MIKNVYTLFDKDSGIISQSNQVFNDGNGNYSRVLKEREENFINHSGATFADLERHFVDNRTLTNKPLLPIRIDKTEIIANPNKGVIIRRIPKNVQLTLSVIVFGQTSVIHSQQFDGPELEIPFDVPGVYVVSFRKHPYRDWATEIQVTA